MAKPRPVETKSKKTNGFLSSYYFPIGAVYNIKTVGGSELGGTAKVQICKSAKNIFIKQLEERKAREAQQSLIDYALSEMNRVYGGNPPSQ